MWRFKQHGYIDWISRVFMVKPLETGDWKRPGVPSVNCDGKLAAFGIPNTKRKIFWSLGFDNMILRSFWKWHRGSGFGGMFFFSTLAILNNLELKCSMKYGVWYLTVWFQVKILVWLGICGIWYLLFVDFGTYPFLLDGSKRALIFLFSG